MPSIQICVVCSLRWFVVLVVVQSWLRKLCTLSASVTIIPDTRSCLAGPQYMAQHKWNLFLRFGYHNGRTYFGGCKAKNLSKRLRRASAIVLRGSALRGYHFGPESSSRYLEIFSASFLVIPQVCIMPWTHQEDMELRSAVQVRYSNI